MYVVGNDSVEGSQEECRSTSQKQFTVKVEPPSQLP